MLRSMDHQSRLCSYYFENPVASYQSCIQWQQQDLDAFSPPYSEERVKPPSPKSKVKSRVTGLIRPVNGDSICLCYVGNHQDSLECSTQSKEDFKSNCSVGDGKLCLPRTSNCDNFVVDDNSIDYRMRYVGDQLAHLVRDIHNIDSNENNNNGQCSPTGTLANSSEFIKMRRILRLYEKLLKVSPLDFHLKLRGPKSSCRGQAVATDLNSTRQQVLFYIENLHGYCDSINTLRLIMKSPEMIRVIGAYETLAAKWLAWDQTVNESKVQPSIQIMGAFEWSV